MKKLTSCEEERSAWASNWLLLTRALTFLEDAITDIGTVTMPHSLMETTSIKTTIHRLLVILFHDPYHSLQDLCLCVLPRSHLQANSCH